MKASYNHRRPSGGSPLTAHHSPLARRSGFTLIEMLVVMAIMAILVAMIAAAVMRVRAKSDELKNRNNISQLATSMQGISAKIGVDFIPSRIVLREDGAYGTNANKTIAQWELASLAYLKRYWPRLATPSTPNFAGHDWNGDGQITIGDQGAFVLEGDQCLLFFLGGIQRNGACFGFGANKQYPANIFMPNATASAAEPPAMDFPTTQVGFVGTPSLSRTAFFMSFLDPYGMPYVYFSNRGGAGGYLNAYNNGTVDPTSDCNGVIPAGALWPYYDPNTNKYYSPQGFQIISAGRDNLFGPGGPWDSRTGAPLNNPNDPTYGGGFDDLTNFHERILGAGTP